MSSVSPAAVTRPSPQAARGTESALLSSLPSIFKEMIMLAVAVVIPVALVMLILASPPYYSLTLTLSREGLRDAVGRNDTEIKQDLLEEQPLKLGLYYFTDWGMRIWGIYFFSQLCSTVLVFLLAGHIVRNMEGGPSLRRRLLMSTIHLLIVIINYALSDFMVVTSGRWDWKCNSPGMSNLRTVWNLFSLFGLNVLSPMVIFYYATKDLTDKKGAKNWRYASILNLAGAVYVYLMAFNPKIILIFFNAKGDADKMLVRLVIVPAMNSLGFQLVNWASKKLKLHDPTDSVYLTMMFLQVSSFYSRFLQNSLSTYEGTIILNTVVGLQEIIMRFTLKARGRVFSKYILCQSEADLAALESDVAVSDEIKRNRDYAARLILVEMVTEYVAILLAPLMTIFNQKNSVNVHLGYYDDGSYDVGLLVFSAGTALLLEVAVDTLCFRTQEKWFQLRQQWRRLTGAGKLWGRMYVTFIVGTLLAVVMMIAGFYQDQQYFASDMCAFGDNCMPSPCRCYSSTSPTVTFRSPLSGSNVSLSLPPLFDTLCSQLDQISNPSLYNHNGTTSMADAMSEGDFRSKYAKILTPT